MTDDRYDNWAGDPVLMTVEEINARIRWLDETLMKLRELAATAKPDQTRSSTRSSLIH
jgi:hypothetical protein